MTQAHPQAAYQSTNPASGTVVARFDFASDQSVEDLLAAGAAAFEQRGGRGPARQVV